MNWFKRIFCSQEGFNVHANGLPDVSVSTPMPKVKPPKADKNISEPIISFVKCVQENPKRFKVTYGYEDLHLRLVYIDNTVVSELPESYYYTFKDLQTNESWTLYGGAWEEMV